MLGAIVLTFDRRTVKMSKLSMVAIWILLITNGSPFSLLDEIRKIKINDMVDFPSRNLITKTTDGMMEEISNPRTGDFNGTTTDKYEVEKANKHSIENAANRNQLYLESQSKNSILDLDHTIRKPNKISHFKKNSTKIYQNALKDVTRYRKREAITEVSIKPSIVMCKKTTHFSSNQQSIVMCKTTTHKICKPTTELRSSSASEVSRITPINATTESFTNYSLKSVAGTTKLTSKEVTPLENVTYTTVVTPNLGENETMTLEKETSVVTSSRQSSVTPTTISTTVEEPEVETLTSPLTQLTSKVGTPLVSYTTITPNLGGNETLKLEIKTSVVTPNSTTVEGPKLGTSGLTSPPAQLTSKEVTPLENVTYTTEVTPNLGENETLTLEKETSVATSSRRLSVTPTTISTTVEGPEVETFGLTSPLTQSTSKEVTPLDNVTYTTEVTPNLGENETLTLEIETSVATSSRQSSVTPTTISTTVEGPEVETFRLTSPPAQLTSKEVTPLENVTYTTEVTPNLGENETLTSEKETPVVTSSRRSSVTPTTISTTVEGPEVETLRLTSRLTQLTFTVGTPLESYTTKVTPNLGGNETLTLDKETSVVTSSRRLSVTPTTISTTVEGPEVETFRLTSPQLTSKEMTPLENVTYTTEVTPNLGENETLTLEKETSVVTSSRQLSVTPTMTSTTVEGPEEETFGLTSPLTQSTSKEVTPLESYTTKAIPNLGGNETSKLEIKTSVVTPNITTVEGPKGLTLPLAQLTSKVGTPFENVRYTTKMTPNLGANETLKLEKETTVVTPNSTTVEGQKVGTLGLTSPLAQKVTLPLGLTTTQTNTSRLEELTTKLDSDEIFNSDIAEDDSLKLREMESEAIGKTTLDMMSNVSKTTKGPATLQMPSTFGNHSMNVNLHSLFLGLRSNNMAFNVSYDSNSKNINGTVNVMTNPRTTLHQKPTQTTGYDFIIFPRR